MLASIHDSKNVAPPSHVIQRRPKRDKSGSTRPTIMNDFRDSKEKVRNSPSCENQNLNALFLLSDWTKKNILGLLG